MTIAGSLDNSPYGINTHIILTFVLFQLYHLNAYEGERTVPRIAVQDNSRMSLRVRPEEKATLMRAVALKHTDLTDFVLHHALRAAKAIIEEAERVSLSERDSLRVLNFLEHPPAPNAKLRAAARALPGSHESDELA